MGIRIPKVPQEVPVEKLSRQATRKMMAGRKLKRDPAAVFITPATKYLPPRRPVMFFREVARHRMVMGGTMLINPLGMQAMASLKLITLRHSR